MFFLSILALSIWVAIDEHIEHKRFGIFKTIFLLVFLSDVRKIIISALLIDMTTIVATVLTLEHF